MSIFRELWTKKIIMNAFIISQFGYCPPTWMCHNRKTHKQIDNIHERALRIGYSDNTSSFDELLKKSGSISIHDRNLQQLAIEIYKALNNLSSSLMSELFMKKRTNTTFGMKVLLCQIIQSQSRMESTEFLIWRRRFGI